MGRSTKTPPRATNNPVSVQCAFPLSALPCPRRIRFVPPAAAPPPTTQQTEDQPSPRRRRHHSPTSRAIPFPQRPQPSPFPPSHRTAYSHGRHVALRRGCHLLSHPSGQHPAHSALGPAFGAESDRRRASAVRQHGYLRGCGVPGRDSGLAARAAVCEAAAEEEERGEEVGLLPSGGEGEKGDGVLDEGPGWWVDALDRQSGCWRVAGAKIVRRAVLLPRSVKVGEY